jgi:carbon-monoxide dehydrogenase medium subunit
MTALAVAAPADMAALRTLVRTSAAPLHFIAGGTDMLVGARHFPRTGLLVDLSRTDGMAGVRATSAGIRIGAATTVATLAADRELRDRLPALCQAAEQCGSVQIRNRATIGGNIANASPAADLAPVLLAAGARLLVLCPGGRSREEPFEGFAPKPGKLIVEIFIPADSLLPRSAFIKLGPRDDLAISRLSLAALAEYEDGRFGALRIVGGAIGPLPRRLQRGEEALAGRMLDASALSDFAAALTAEIDAAIPERASRPYKRRAVTGLALDLVAGVTGLSPRDDLFEEVLK